MIPWQLKERRDRNFEHAEKRDANINRHSQEEFETLTMWKTWPIHWDRNISSAIQLVRTRSDQQYSQVVIAGLADEG